MRFASTAVAGCYVIELDKITDDRGFFARTFDDELFAEHGLETAVVQGNMSGNHRAGTVRGLHRQVAPAPEAKLVRCVQGAIVDVCLDLRPDSSSYGEHVMVELTADGGEALFVPPYCAHGYQTLVDDTSVTYQVSGRYAPEAERGHRFDDPAFGIVWPRAVSAISAKDAGWPDWDGAPFHVRH